MTRRAIKIVGTNHVLELSKVTAVKTSKNMFHLDELEDGTWRLIFNGNMIPDYKLIESFKMIREE